MNTYFDYYFVDTYEVSRQRFRDCLSEIQDRWPGADLDRHILADYPDLTIDWIRAEAITKPQRLVMLTTGQHGAEGYVGAAMMQLFVEEFLPQLDSDHTGLLLVHAINPWGMKYMRRVNANNVDLNRNFVWDESALNAAANPNYRLLNSLLNPTKKLRNLILANIDFFFKLIKNMISPGEATLRAAMLMGQYAHPEGVYYGGNEVQEETQQLMALYRKAIQGYDQIVHLDMHTGYGPRYQMSLVNSPLERRSAQDLEQAFDYPQVVAATPDEFYSMQGDMIDWMYRLVGQEYPEKLLFATTFEFGTLGDSLPASIRSMRAIINENRCHWYGAGSESIKHHVFREFEALFSPKEIAWREKAVADARQAFSGILKTEGFIG